METDGSIMMVSNHSVWKSLKKYHFDIASEASYVYILGGLKFLKNAKNWVFENLKLLENAKIQMRYFGWFSNTVHFL